MRKIIKAAHNSAAGVEWTHPEVRPLEVFLINMSRSQFDAFPWSSKRIGRVAYDGEGHRQTAFDWYPTFVAALELEARTTTLAAVRRMIRESRGAEAAA